MLGTSITEPCAKAAFHEILRNVWQEVDIGLKFVGPLVMLRLKFINDWRLFFFLIGISVDMFETYHLQ